MHNHFKLQSAKLQEEISLSKRRLKLKTNEKRFKFLTEQLNQFSRKKKYELSKKKEKKIQKLQWTRENISITEKEENLEWLPTLHLKKEDRDIIKNGAELNDLHITTAMNLLQNDYPIVVQPPSVGYTLGFDYCPYETVQVLHNGSHHWLLVSQMKGMVNIFDSLNMTPTEKLLKQLTQLFSPDEALPAYKQHNCHKQIGYKDCGVFAIAYAVDVLLGNEPHNIRYDQCKMRDHLIACYESGELTSFPKFSTDDNIKTKSSNGFNTSNEIRNTELKWSTPKRYHLRPRNTQLIQKGNVTTSNRFSVLQNDRHVSPKANSTTLNKHQHQINRLVHNISNITLDTNEIALLEKGLNFSPSYKDVNQEELLDDVFTYCRNIRLKHYFQQQNVANNSSMNNLPQTITPPVERCEMKSIYKNPYFDPQAKFTPANLEKYLASTKMDILKLINNPSQTPSNLSSSERQTLKSLKNRNDIIITNADKGGKVVVMDRNTYIENCENQLNDNEFYMKIEQDPTTNTINEIQSEIAKMTESKLIDTKESKLLTEHLIQPRMSIFYGLPKIHKTFIDFPPLRPIVSGFSSCTSRLSEYIDTFLKFQARKSQSFIRDTKDFLSKHQIR